MLELDHVLCMVDPEDAWAERLTAAGWELDAGMSHPGQGIRNRRLVLAGHYLELAWIEDRAEARANSLRLDRRADWATTGASPFGIGLRGRLLPEEEPALWLYEDLGFPIWCTATTRTVPDTPWSSSWTSRPAGRPGQPRTPGCCSAWSIGVPAPQASSATPVRAWCTARAGTGSNSSSTRGAPSR